MLSEKCIELKLILSVLFHIFCLKKNQSAVLIFEKVNMFCKIERLEG